MSFCNYRNYIFYKYRIRQRVTKKSVVVGLCFLTAIYLLLSGDSNVEEEAILKTRRLDDCLSSISANLEHLVDSQDALESASDDEAGSSPTFFPFVGNGYFGASAGAQRQLFITGAQPPLSVVDIDPLLDFRITGFTAMEKVVLDLLHGQLHKFGCYKQHSMCVSIHYSVVAHRTVPNLLLQDLVVSNPTTNLVNVELVRQAAYERPVGGRSSQLTVAGQEYALSTVGVRLASGRLAAVSLAEPSVGAYLAVKPGATSRLRLRSCLRHSGNQSSEASQPGADLRWFHAQSLQQCKQLLLAGSHNAAVDEHRQQWRRLWRQGFSISRSLAPGALNGDRINSTLYYLMSSRPLLPADERAHRYDRCFAGHALMQVQQLWQRPQSPQSLASLVEQWLVTVEKFGCSQLVAAGAGGVAQAALLAVGEFRFSGSHLEFNLHPSELVRNMLFRSIAYGPGAAVNVSVQLDDTNRARLFVSVNSNKQFYACSAACAEESPAVLADRPLQLPLRVTRPRTPLLYVSPNPGHIRQLKRAIHVRELRDAPAHEHHVIALHRHGHPYGGLPAIFWVGLVLLLVVFHLFLFKLIYTELCRGEPIIQPYRRRVSP